MTNHRADPEPGMLDRRLTRRATLGGVVGVGALLGAAALSRSSVYVTRTSKETT